MKFFFLFFTLTCFSQFNSKKSIKYLESENNKWNQDHLNAKADSGDACISCHTSLPTALIHPTPKKSKSLAKTKKYISTRIHNFKRYGFLDNPETKEHKNSNQPWYEATPSFSNELIISSVILLHLSKKDQNFSDKQLVYDGLKLLFSRQLDSGSFNWLDYFDLEPFESKHGVYWGLTHLIHAIESHPKASSIKRIKTKHVKGHSLSINTGIKKIKTYLSKKFKSQPLHNKLMAIWAENVASQKFLKDNEILKTIKEVKKLYREKNSNQGGWNIFDFFKRTSPDKINIDTYATCLTIISLGQLASEVMSSELKNAKKWALKQMKKNGAFETYSLNTEEKSVYMSHVATSLCIEALQ